MSTTPRINIDAQTWQQLQQTGELQVTDSRGVPLILMTVDARKELREAPYDASEHSVDEYLPYAHEAFAEDWDAPGMELYHDYDSHKPSDS